MRPVCPGCGWIAFGNAKPAVGVLIERERKLLLVRRERAPFKGYWDIPGGFLEEDEHPRTGAVREAREETGLRIAIDDLLGVYHDRSGDTYTLNLYYHAHVLGGRERAGDDADDLKWFGRADLPKRIAFPGHAKQVLRDWLKAQVM